MYLMKYACVYVFMKDGCLLVLVVEISKTTTPLVGLLVPLESLPWKGVHQVSFIMFQLVLEKSLNIIFKKKKNSFKSKKKIIREFGCALDIVEKPQVNSI